MGMVLLCSVVFGASTGMTPAAGGCHGAGCCVHYGDGSSFTGPGPQRGWLRRNCPLEHLHVASLERLALVTARFLGSKGGSLQ